MPSPFPGMDPYLEHEYVFHDFHNVFLIVLRNALAALVRPAYFARTDVNVYIHELSGVERLAGRPDVFVGETSRRARSNVVAAPVTSESVLCSLSPAVDIVEIPYIQIMDRASRRVVTVIEVLSPTNKLADRAAFLAKRHALLRTGVHYVEIDLLRAGEPMPLDGLPASAYRVAVCRAERRPEAEVWPFGLRDPLPAVPIPLNAPDPDAMLDLAAALATAYDQGAYVDTIYGDEPQPPLDARDAAWAASLLAARPRG